MRIDGLSQQPKVSHSQQRNAPVRSHKAGERADDVVEISRGAQEVSELSDLARSTPAEANPRIQEIRERVQSGYYNSRQVREEIADSLLASDGLRETLTDVARFRTVKQELDQVPDARPESVQTARQRVDEGFYERSEIRRDTAERILDELA